MASRETRFRPKGQRCWSKGHEFVASNVTITPGRRKHVMRFPGLAPTTPSTIRSGGPDTTAADTVGPSTLIGPRRRSWARLAFRHRIRQRPAPGLVLSVRTTNNPEDWNDDACDREKRVCSAGLYAGQGSRMGTIYCQTPRSAERMTPGHISRMTSATRSGPLGRWRPLTSTRAGDAVEVNRADGASDRNRRRIAQRCLIRQRSGRATGPIGSERWRYPTRPEWRSTGGPLNQAPGGRLVVRL